MHPNTGSSSISSTHMNKHSVATRRFSYDGINHDVTKLRSLYSTLLNCITETTDRSSSEEEVSQQPLQQLQTQNSCSIYQENVMGKPRSVNDVDASAEIAQEDDSDGSSNKGEDGNKGNSNKEEPRVVVRNFRSISTNLDQETNINDVNAMDEAEAAITDLEPLTSKTTSTNIWNLLSAYNDTFIDATMNTTSQSSSKSTNIRQKLARSVLQSEEQVAAFQQARHIECRVIDIIQSIGELAVCGERRKDDDADHDDNSHHRNINGKKKKSNGLKVQWGYTSYSNSHSIVHQGNHGNQGTVAIFEYFCDKNILSLLVDIVKAKPISNTSNANSTIPPSISFTTMNTQQSSSSSSLQNQQPPVLPFNGVVWTPHVKAQVIQTISILISNVQDPKSLYYLLSNNYINQLILSILPLNQWTDNGREKILPVYIGLLKTLALQLANSPHLFEFYCCGMEDESSDKSSSSSSSSSPSLSKFPLFQAAVEVASSSIDVALSDNLVHTTAMNIILNVCQLQNTEIRSAISDSHQEQSIFVSSICHELNLLYQDIIAAVLNHDDAANANDDDSLDSNDETIKAKVQKLDDRFCFLNDLLWCSIRNLNVKLCESIMQQFIYKTLMQNILLSSNDEEDEDEDVVSSQDDCSIIASDNNNEQTKKEKTTAKKEKIHKQTKSTHMQTSLYVLAKIFMTIDYVPLLKMIAVAILHPYSPLSDQLEEMERQGNEYIMTPALNAIAQNDFVVVSSSAVINDESNSNFSNALMEESTTLIIESECSSDQDDDSNISIAVSSNMYRASIIHHLSGLSGSKGFMVAAMLLESIIEVEAIDYQMLKMLEVVPCYVKDDLEISSKGSADDDFSAEDKETTISSAFEDAIGSFFATFPKSWTNDTSLSFDIATSLLTRFLSSLFKSFIEDGATVSRFRERILSSSLQKGITAARKDAVEECKSYQGMANLSLLFPELLTMEISSLYDYTNGSSNDQAESLTSCNLRKVNASHLKNTPSLFTVSNVKQETDEVKDAQFSIRKVLLLRLLDEVSQEVANRVSDMLENHVSASAPLLLKDELFSFRTICPMSEEISVIGAIQKKPTVGANMSIKDKSYFYFSPSLAITNNQGNRRKKFVMTENDRRRQIADKILVQSSSKTEMTLVVDSEAIYVLKPKSKLLKSGTILCYTNLQNILAVAPDEQWLHIAMRNVEDVGVLIQKGKFIIIQLFTYKILFFDWRMSLTVKSTFFNFLGNMALRFDRVETCQLARESIEKYRAEAKSSVMLSLRKMLDSSY